MLINNMIWRKLKLLPTRIKWVIKKNRVLHSFLSKSWFFINRSVRILKSIILNLSNIRNELVLLNKNALVIEVSCGGLGDHLFFSHIPRIAKETKQYDKVYLSMVSPLRRDVHQDFIWKENPFVDGFVSIPGTIYRGKYDESVLCQMNILDQIMLFYNLDDGARFHEPELYYKPKILEEYAGKVIFDPNFVTNLNDTHTLKSVTKYFEDNNIKVDMQFRPRNNCVPLRGCDKYIDDKSFGEFCDILHSCKDIYCYATGTAVLSAALGKSSKVFYHDKIHKRFLFSKINKYIYIKEKKK